MPEYTNVVYYIITTFVYPSRFNFRLIDLSGFGSRSYERTPADHQEVIPNVFDNSLLLKLLEGGTIPAVRNYKMSLKVQNTVLITSPIVLQVLCQSYSQPQPAPPPYPPSPAVLLFCGRFSSTNIRHEQANEKATAKAEAQDPAIKAGGIYAMAQQALLYHRSGCFPEKDLYRIAGSGAGGHGFFGHGQRHQR